MIKQISRIHFITLELYERSHVLQADQLCQAGADWVQLRIKNKPEKEWEIIARDTLSVCNNYNVKLIINDNVRIAKQINADGVHLGKQDMPVEEARKILSDDFVIGGTANTFEDIRNLAASGVDYIGLGPLRFTATKEKISPVLGMEGFLSIMEKCRLNQIDIPIIAIGGIRPDDVKPLLCLGVYGVAVSSSVLMSGNIFKSVTDFLLQFKKDK